MSTRKESERREPTYCRTQRGRTSQDTKESEQVKGSLSGVHREHDKSELGKGASERGVLTPWRANEGDKSGYEKEASEGHSRP
jgi:hypothetical protein